MSFSRLLINHIAKTILIILLYAAALFAQQDTVMNDTRSDTVFVMSKSPWLSVLFSAAVPGAGQIYNESYWKAPVIWGIGAWLVYNWIDLNDNYKYYQDLYLVSSSTYHRSLRTSYRDERDLFTIYMVLTYILNLVDAYVDAHLFDFTVDEDFYTRQPRLSVKFFLR